ncbi:MAG: hypothetical protein LKM36_07450 [Flavobacteriales bacterium]|jgi:hypothetical protein|nr:hypothetical protein [Flavobacteriales bacterium]
MAGILIATAWCAFFIFVIRRWRFFNVRALDKRLLPGIFVLKVLVGTFFWWIYTYHYTDRFTADIFKYFDDGNVLFSALPQHPGDYFRMVFGIGNDTPYFDSHYYVHMNHWSRQWDTGYYNDAHTMIRYSALVRLFSFGHYHVHTVFACFFALVGLMAMYRAFASVLPGGGVWLAAGVFLWPSILFWGSAPIKEALLFFGLGLFVLGASGFARGRTGPKEFALLGAGLFIQLILKSYVLACLLPALAAYAWSRGGTPRSTLLKFTVAYGAATALLLALPLVHPGWDVLGLIAQKRRDMLGVVSLTDPGSYIPFPPLANGPIGFLLDIPHALYLTFLSPFQTWHIGAMGLIGAAENLVMLALVPVAILWAKPWRQINIPLVLLCAGFCLALGLLVGWTTPVVGALLRYRVPLLPFWSLAVLAVIDIEKLPRWNLRRIR